MGDEVDIYVAVTGAAGSSWRPVKAIPRGDDVYEIVGGNPSPAVETWQFASGDLVRCKPYELTDNDRVLVAYERVTKGG